MRKKVLAGFLAASMIAGMLAGCGNTGGQSTAQPESKAVETNTEKADAENISEHEPVELVFWNAALNDIDDSGVFSEDELAFNIAMKRFKESYPYVNVEVVRYGVEELNQLLTAASLSGDLPDVICTWAGSYTNNYKDLLLNLEEYMTEEEIDSYTALDICREGMQPSGKLQALPEGLTTYNIFYNKQVFADAGIEEGYEPQTWEDFLDICQKIVDHTDAVPVATVADGSMEAWVLSEFLADELGPDDLSKLGTGEIKFDSEVFEMVYNEYKKLFDLGYVNEDWKSADYNATSAAFCNGEAAMQFGGSWGHSSMNDLMGDSVGTFKIPACRAESPYGDYIISQPGLNLAVINTTEIPEEAVAFIQMFSDGEYQQVDCFQFGNIPSNKNADPTMITNPLTMISNEWILNDKNLIGFDSLINAEAASEFYKNSVLVNAGSMQARELGKILDTIIAKGVEKAE